MSVFLTELPAVPAKLYLIGIGGIGMSGLAQLLVARGYQVAGSDRGLEEPGKQGMYQALRARGIALYPQDGSGIAAFSPDALIYSTAVEDGNPDYRAAGKAFPRMHRARALSLALRMDSHAALIAVAGSCGKTSVTAWIAAALHALGEPVLMVAGGYVADFPGEPGNFYADPEPRWMVVEVDESDRSIGEFSPDFGVLLNVGDDHYSRKELQQVFSAFIGRCLRGAVVEASLLSLCPQEKTEVIRSFSVRDVKNYQVTPDGMTCDLPELPRCPSRQTGLHSAWNAAAVLALLRQLFPEVSPDEYRKAIGAFMGVQQRFEWMGNRSDGVPFVNDYAHNPEKIAAAVSAARERFGSPLLLIYQPHGFHPLGFMRDALRRELQRVLNPDDRLVLLPVFYAGGTADFTPTSREVAEDYASAGLPVVFWQREEVESWLAGHRPAAVLVMGARDSSLRPWTLQLMREQPRI